MNKALFKKPLFYLNLFLIFVLLFRVVNWVSADFREPTVPFPKSSVSVPLDTSSTAQTKDGELMLKRLTLIDSGLLALSSGGGICLKDDSSQPGVSCKLYWNQIGTQWGIGPNGAIYYNGGNVGIGINAPGHKFEVHGKNNGLVYLSTGTSGIDINAGLELRANDPNAIIYVDFTPGNIDVNGGNGGSGDPDYGGRIVYNQGGNLKGFSFVLNKAVPASTVTIDQDGVLKASYFEGDGSRLTGIGGGGAISSVIAGDGLKGGGSSGDVTLNIDPGYEVNWTVFQKFGSGAEFRSSGGDDFYTRIDGNSISNNGSFDLNISANNLIRLNTNSPGGGDYKYVFRDGGLKLHPGSSQPPCGQVTRGLIWIGRKDPSDNDDAYFCRLRGNNTTYEWIRLN